MRKNVNFLKFMKENYERKIKSGFIIYGDIESILVPYNNRKQNPENYKQLWKLQTKNNCLNLWI